MALVNSEPYASERATGRPVADRGATGTEPVRGDTGPVLDRSEAKPRRWRGDLQWHPAVEHAARLLEWLLGTDGKTG